MNADRLAGRCHARPMYRITGQYPIVSPTGLVPEMERQLTRGPRERWLVDSDVGPGRSNDDVAVNDDGPYRLA
jgi:hypothetical protein